MYLSENYEGEIQERLTPMFLIPSSAILFFHWEVKQFPALRANSLVRSGNGKSVISAQEWTVFPAEQAIYFRVYCILPATHYVVRFFTFVGIGRQYMECRADQCIVQDQHCAAGFLENSCDHLAQNNQKFGTFLFLSRVYRT